MNFQVQRYSTAMLGMGDIAPTPIGSPGDVTVVDTVNMNDLSWFQDAEMCSLISSSFVPTTTQTRKREAILSVEGIISNKKRKYDPLDDCVVSSREEDKFFHLVDGIEDVDNAHISAYTNLSNIHVEEPYLRRISQDSVSSPISIASMFVVQQEEQSKKNNTSLLRRVSTTISEAPSLEAKADLDEKASSKTKIRRFQFEQWTLRYDNLKKFQAQHGHCLVNESHEDHDLAKWVKRQRYQYKLKQNGCHSTMTDQRIEALEEIGFIWNPHRAAWEERFNELLEFKSTHGHCNVPCTYTNQRLSSWVQAQRRQAKLFTLDAERFQRLANVGFEWKAPTHTAKKRGSASSLSGSTTNNACSV